jgi:predicted ATPase
MGICHSEPALSVSQALFQAVKVGDTETFTNTLNKLSQNRSVDELLGVRDNNDNTLLIKACSLGSYHLVRLLIERYGAGMLLYIHSKHSTIVYYVQSMWLTRLMCV